VTPQAGLVSGWGDRSVNVSHWDETQRWDPSSGAHRWGKASAAAAVPAPEEAELFALPVAAGVRPPP